MDMVQVESGEVVRGLRVRLAREIRRTRQLEARGRCDREELAASRGAIIFGLAKLAESRDDDTGLHLERICRYTEILARRLSRDDEGLDERWVENMAATAALHDIGKVATPDAVLLKPGKLDAAERRVIEKHPYVGGDRLIELKRRWSGDRFLVTAAEIALAHHEKWDGSGYPFGLKGEMIPFSARIVALADDRLVWKFLQFSSGTLGLFSIPFTHHVAPFMGNLLKYLIFTSYPSHMIFQSNFNDIRDILFLDVEGEFEAISRGMRSTSEKRK